MRMNTLAGALAVLACAACEDSLAPRRVPLTVDWMEWPAQVTAAAPGAVRVVTSASGCGAVYLRSVAAGDRIVVEVDFEAQPGRVCAASLTAVDTMIPLPVLAGDPAYYWIEARIYDSWNSKFVQHTFGRLRFGAPSDPVTLVGGLATLYAETNGCGIAIPQGLSRYAVTNLPADTSFWHVRHVMLEGRLDPAVPAPCGSLPALRLTRLEIPVQ